MSLTFLGIDLGSARIKLTRLQLSGKHVHILGQKQLLRGSDGCLQGTIESVSQAIQDLGPYSRLHLSLSSREALLMPLTFPFTQTRKIREVLPFELENQISVDLSEYLWDFIPLAGGDTPVSRVLAAMYPKQKLHELLQAFEDVEIRPDRIDLDLAPLALLATEQADPNCEMEIFLDIGWNKLNLACLRFGRICSLQSISPGLKTIVADRNGNEDDRIAPGQMMHTPDTQGLKHLVQQLRLTGLAESDGALPQRLTLLGGGASVSEIIGFLEQEVGVSVTAISRPYWDSRGALEDLPAAALSAAICLQGGKDRNGFDLLPPELAATRRQSPWRKHGRPLAVCLGLILLSWSISLGSSIYLELRSLDSLQERVRNTFYTTVSDASKDLRPMQYASVLRSRIQELEYKRAGQETSGVKAIEVLRLISQSVPEGVTFQTTLLALDSNGLRLNGLASDYKTVDSLQNALSDLDVFSSVEIIGANVDSREDSVSFSLRMKLA